jgi:tRNA(Phe) wybutosine-synthesizing methylase Tyw3
MVRSVLNEFLREKDQKIARLEKRLTELERAVKGLSRGAHTEPR